MRDDLADFDRQEMTFDGTTRVVLRAGEGPCVIVLSEIPGITTKVADIGRRLVGRGFSVALPSLFGIPGYPATRAAVAARTAWICVASEVRALARGYTRPLSTWVRALAEDLHAEVGGPGVGVIGLCLSASVALGATVSPAIAAPVLSQPSMPLPLTASHRRDVGVCADDLARVKERTDEGLCLLGLRFSHDVLSPRARFDSLRRELGDAITVVELDSSPGNPHGIPSTVHSVLGHDYIDGPGHPTRQAFETVVDFLSARLQHSPSAAAEPR